MMLVLLSILALSIALIAHPQSGRPAFDVASIKLSLRGGSFPYRHVAPSVAVSIDHNHGKDVNSTANHLCLN